MGPAIACGCRPRKLFERHPWAAHDRGPRVCRLRSARRPQRTDDEDCTARTCIFEGSREVHGLATFHQIHVNSKAVLLYVPGFGSGSMVCDLMRGTGIRARHLRKKILRTTVQ